MKINSHGGVLTQRCNDKYAKIVGGRLESKAPHCPSVASNEQE